MRISELMEQLEAILASEGDIDAQVIGEDGWLEEPIVGIDRDEVRRWVIL